MDRPVKILIPLDGSPLAEEALGPAQEFAQALNGTLVLTRVVACPHYDAHIEGEIYIPEEGYTLIPEPEDVARLAEAQIYLEDLAAPLRTNRQPVEVSTTFGVPRVSVARVAQETGADLIVMATHGHSGLTRALLGSVATSTLQRANVPLLLVRRSPAQLTAQTSTSMSAPITEEVVPSDEALPEPVAPISLSFNELETLIASIGERFHEEPVDPRYAEPTQALLARLRAARASFWTPTAVS
jgi:nucleotide-binding universal stress UspA family protein